MSGAVHAPGGLHERFVRLCEIRSPSGQERDVADAVTAELRSFGLEVEEDGAAEATDAGAGNLICRIPGAKDGWALFAAHLDTVPDGGAVEVELADGIYRSRGDTILGADNKAAVAVLLELARVFSQAAPPVGVELVFTVGEEVGLRGAHFLDTEKLHAKAGFVFDHASDIGDIVMAAPTYQRLDVEFSGTEAHAGIRPEAGRSAVRAAALAVGEMALGRLDEATTANVGVIAGGTATNVVAGRCRIEAEARSLDDRRASEVAAAMVEACNWAAGEAECDVDVELATLFRAYRLRPADPQVDGARQALARCGYEPRLVESGGGSDVNALNSKGLACVNLGNGTYANHTPDEHMPAASLDSMLGVARALVDAAAATCSS